MTATRVNPYESPQPVSENVNRSWEPVRNPIYLSAISVIVAPLAGGAGASLFVPLLQGLDHEYCFQIAQAAGCVATYLVLLAADGLIRQQGLAWGSAMFGMAMMWPQAFALAFGLGFIAYGLGTKGLPGAQLMMWVAYASFFLMLSLGGWLAICWARKRPVSEQQLSN